ncbi:MAG: DUF4432 family protein [Saprospiraceae bacterium]|nr:DUF4432 family protein [Saprospiraceae bacterium]
MLFPQNRCTISDEWTLNNMRVVWMENDLIKVGILVGRGSDIFEFRFKPVDVNLLLRLPTDIINPQQIVSQIRSTENQMEDYYYGGWQEALPNSAPFTYRGAQLGQHGEVWMIPWKYSIVERGPEQVSVKMWAQPLRVPLLIEKTLSIDQNSSALMISEKLTNVSRTDLDIMWGHHIAFGLPFLAEGAEINSNATSFLAEPSMPAHRRFLAGQTFDWPQVKDIDGQPDDASMIPPREDQPYSDLAYLSGFEKDAYYTIRNRANNVGFAVKWDPGIFKYLWYWQERYATQDAPWWGSAYAVGLEPWTTRYRTNAEQAVRNGEFLKIAAGQSIETALTAVAYVGQEDEQTVLSNNLQ